MSLLHHAVLFAIFTAVFLTQAFVLKFRTVKGGIGTKKRLVRNSILTNLFLSLAHAPYLLMGLLPHSFNSVVKNASDCFSLLGCVFAILSFFSLVSPKRMGEVGG